VIVNGLTIEQAIGACNLQGIVPTTTLYSRVQARRVHGTYNGVHIRKPAASQQEEKIDMVIDVTGDDETASTNVSPVTLYSTQSSSSTSLTTSTSKSTKRSRLSPKQASAKRLEAKRTRLDYDARYKAAFKDATNLVAATTGEPVQAICNRLNRAFNLDGKKRLARSTIYQATKNGLAGVSPMKKGPQPKIQINFLEMVATHAEICQVGDGELRGKDLRRLIGASMVGTPHANAYKVESVWRKVRTEFPDALQAATKIAVEDARAQWTTYDNLNQWFDDVKRDLLATGLVEDEQVLDEKGGLVSEVRFKMHSERRIINMDETHHDLSITGDKGGSRAVSYHNPLYQRGATRGVKSARHVTGAYATNAAGEALPPFYIYDSSAKSDDNFRVKIDWLVGLPSVSGRYGCPTRVESDSFYAVRPRGSMDETLLNQYIETVIIPLYPNMHKTAEFDSVTGKLNRGPVILKVDAGPGRIVSSEQILAQREALFERGLIIILGLPNATSVQQEMDALYGPFKSATYARGEKVVQEKLKQRGLARRNGERLPCAVLNLDFGDLPTIVNGTPDDSDGDRPFKTHFTKEKILWSWQKVGFVPFTRSCLHNKRVRKELGQHKEDTALENLQFRYDVLVDSIEGDGFNPGIFDAVIPMAVHVDRAETHAAQVEQLLSSGKAFSASGQWNHCESRIGNAGVTLTAQKQQLALNEAARLRVADKKNEAQAKTLEKAQAALTKYKFNSVSLTDKDWGDVVRWVLPEAKVQFLLKDLKKRDQIVAKLATLPRDWTTYIPCEEVVPDIPAAPV
jgi:hypothetical protein